LILKQNETLKQGFHSFRFPKKYPGTMNFKLAKLYDADGNLAARWFVFYYFNNPVTGKYQRFG